MLARIASDDAHLADIFDLDNATNDRLLAENRLLPGIGIHELVFGVPYYRIVNAAFTHAHPLGSRFNGPDRGAWYAALAIDTAQAEVAFHKSTEYAEIGRFDDSVTYDDYLADFSCDFHELRGDDRFADCLDPDSYVASQTLAHGLSTAARWASSIRACATPAAPAWLVFARPWSATSASARPGASPGPARQRPRSRWLGSSRTISRSQLDLAVTHAARDDLAKPNRWVMLKDGRRPSRSRLPVRHLYVRS